MNKKLSKEVRITIVKEAIKIFDERPDFLCCCFVSLIEEHADVENIDNEEVVAYIPEFRRVYVPKKSRRDPIFNVWFENERNPITGKYSFNIVDRKKYLVRLLKRIEKSVD